MTKPTKADILWFLRGMRNELSNLRSTEEDQLRLKNLDKANQIALYLENFYLGKRQTFKKRP